jgi:HD-GYP domain-containing protein (c-di-GMP phosphodiesterase class II)
MQIRMDQLIMGISAALDIVEGSLLGASTNHGKRIAVLSAAMGRSLGMDERSIRALTTCALFHDSALTEYILSEREANDPAMKLHCIAGQRNAESLIFDMDIEGHVCYHHERADGAGPFGKREGEFPREAALIAIADMLDAACHFQRLSPENLGQIRREIRQETGKTYTREAAEAMLGILDAKMLSALGDKRIHETARETIPPWRVNLEAPELFRIAALSARIIDYKSVFTRRHSEEIALRAWIMAESYGYGHPQRSELYLAATLHDIGKLAVPTEILEKPGPLNQDEFAVIKDHVRHTDELLSGISGLDYIRKVASSHHEKLDGSGYPFGKTGEDLDFNDRLLACIDIYQAVSEARPYHEKRSHRETMTILSDMAEKGLIDRAISADMDQVMAEYPEAILSCLRLSPEAGPVVA